MPGVRDRFGQQRAHVVVVQRVDDVPPVALTGDQTKVTQHPRLLETADCSISTWSELTDRARTDAEAIEDADS